MPRTNITVQINIFKKSALPPTLLTTNMLKCDNVVTALLKETKGREKKQRRETEGEKE